MRFILFYCLLISTQILWSQDQYLDLRDNNSYSVVTVNELTWFQENIRYQTPNSFCQGDKLKLPHCQQGNYYPYTELTEVCPDGWHIATVREWESLIAYLIEVDDVEQSISEDSIENGTIMRKIEPLPFMDNATPLKFKELGWVQGERLRKKESATLWLKNEVTNDDRYHVHFGDNSYARHAHVHHVQETKRKNRRFSVRCIKDKK